MKTEHLYTLTDIRRCFEIYYKSNDETFWPVSRSKSLSTLTKLSTNSQLLGIKENDVVKAWIGFEITEIGHLDGLAIRQLYFATAFNDNRDRTAIRLLHNKLCEIGISRLCTIATAESSPLDDNRTVVKLLARDGWQVRGFMAVKWLPRANSRRVSIAGGKRRVVEYDGDGVEGRCRNEPRKSTI